LWLFKYHHPSPYSGSHDNDGLLVSGDTQKETISDVNATFRGTGDPDACTRLLEVLVYKVESWKCNPKPCAIGSFYQPTLPPNMTFYAIGAFIHALTAVHALDANNVYVPSYGIDKAYEYCRKVCVQTGDKQSKHSPTKLANFSILRPFGKTSCPSIIS
jgi:hypothetical protein